MCYDADRLLPDNTMGNLMQGGVRCVSKMRHMKNKRLLFSTFAGDHLGAVTIILLQCN